MTADMLVWGLRTGLVVSGLIGLVLLLRRPFAKYLGAEATFLLWCLPFLRFCFPNIQLPEAATAIVTPLQNTPFNPAAEFGFIQGAGEQGQPVIDQALTASIQANIPMLLVTLWLGGSAIWLAYHAWRHTRYSRRLLSVSSEASAGLHTLLRQAANIVELAHNPKLFTAPISIGPMISGVFRPYIILPKDFETLYTVQEQRLALCHELAHISRRDMWWALAMLIFRALNWYNPLVHYAAGRFRIDQEAACDARVLSYFGSDKSLTHNYALALCRAENAATSKASRMSGPLALGMGHPVTERIRRLSMRKSNLLTRSASAALIIAALGITAPIFSDAAAEPILDTVQDRLTETSLAAKMSPRPDSKTLLAETTESGPEMASTAAKTTARQTRLRPLQLRMKLDATAAHIDEVDGHRQAAVRGDQNARQQINASMSKVSYKNRFQVSISDSGLATAQVSLGAGGWPGYPASNTKWETRPLSADMQRGLKAIMEKCASAAEPVYFNAQLLRGDGDIGKGQYEVGCVPGSEVIRSQVTQTDLAYAYLKSDELPLEKRQDYFQWKIGFAAMDDYVTANPDATLADDRAACVRMNTEHKEKHTFTDRHRETYERFLSKCPQTDYNWVRRRKNLPEI